MPSVIGRGRYITRTYPVRIAPWAVPPIVPGENGFIPRADNGELEWFGGSTNQFVGWDGAKWAAITIQTGSLPAGEDGQVLTTALGVATWATIIDANVSAIAAIAGTKISPDFGTQNVITTGGFIANSQTSFIRLGLASGSGAGVASAASRGSIRGSRGAGATTTTDGGFIILVRNNSDTADHRAMGWDSTLDGGVLVFGSTTGGFEGLRAINLNAINQIDLFGGGSRVRLNSTTAEFQQTSIIFANTASDTVFGVQSAEGGTGNTLRLRGQARFFAGVACTGGSVVVSGGTAGTAGATPTVSVGGKLTLQGGDAGNGTVSNTGSDALFRAGRGSGTSSADGSIAIHADPVGGFRDMQRGLFIGNASVVPSGDPTTGFYFYSDTTRPAFRWAGTTLRFNGTSASANVGGGGALPATVEGYLDVQINGTQRKIPYYVT